MYLQPQLKHPIALLESILEFEELSLAIEHAEEACNITHHHDSDSDGDMPELIDADSDSDDEEGEDNVFLDPSNIQTACPNPRQCKFLDTEWGANLTGGA